jgi:NAD-dependent deacetylase
MYQFSSAQILTAARIIVQAKRLVVFTGSGMSKESGIPTFRDPGGLWDRFDPEELSFQTLIKSLAQGRFPEGAFAAFFLEFIKTLKRATPNPGHAALKALEDLGILKAVITQNIDNLHAEAGNNQVVELHGNIYMFVCLNCQNKRFFGKEGFLRLAHTFIEALQSADAQRVFSAVPRCSCGGAMRPDIVGFGEPIKNFDRALSLTVQSDVFLIVGTSGEVMPAASLPEHAKRSGATLIEVNLSHGAFPECTDLYIQGSAATVLPKIALEIED